MKCYIVLVVNNDHRLAASCEQLWPYVQADSLRLVGHFHPRPPHLAILQLEDEHCVADVEICHFFVLEPISNHLTHEVYGLIHLQPDFGFYPQLSVFVGSPPVELAVVHQGYRVGFTALNLFDFHFLLPQKVLKMLVFDWQVIVFVVAVPKGCVLTVSPVINFLFVVEDNAKVASCCDSLDVHSL